MKEQSPLVTTIVGDLLLNTFSAIRAAAEKDSSSCYNKSGYVGRIAPFPEGLGVWRVFPAPGLNDEDAFGEMLLDAKNRNEKERNNAITKDYYFVYIPECCSWMIDSKDNVDLVYNKEENNLVFWITPELLDKFNFGYLCLPTDEFLEVFEIKHLGDGTMSFYDEYDILLINAVTTEELCEYSQAFLRKPKAKQKEQPTNEKTYPMLWIAVRYFEDEVVFIKNRSVKVVCKGTGLVGKADCRDTDKFDLTFGIELATARLNIKRAKRKERRLIEEDKKWSPLLNG